MAVFALSPPVKQVRVDVGGAIVSATVHDEGDRVVLPIFAKLKSGGYFRAVVEVDHDTFDRAVSFAEQRGLTAVRLADIAERFFGHRPLVTVEERPMLNAGGED